MRGVSGLLAATVLVAGCATDAYRIPNNELTRLAFVAPESRGARVRVIEEIKHLDAPSATHVERDDVVVVPNIYIGSGGGGGGGGPRGGGGGGGGIGGAGGDGKAAAVVFLVVAATAMFIAAGVEGSRFDGWAALHPMHPLHLYGRDGTYVQAPLAALTPETVGWIDRAYVRASEGPWLELDRAPLSRHGWTYSMYGGAATMRSVAGDKALGTAFLVQGGYFPTQELGIQVGVFVGWRDNQVNEVLFDSRYMLEGSFMPLQASIFSAGVYGGVGLAYRYEDGLKGGNQGEDGGSTVLTAGIQLQLELHTRIALTGRIGTVRAHDERTTDALIGLSVY